MATISAAGLALSAGKWAVVAHQPVPMTAILAVRLLLAVELEDCMVVLIVYATEDVSCMS